MRRGDGIARHDHRSHATHTPSRGPSLRVSGPPCRVHHRALRSRRGRDGGPAGAEYGVGARAVDRHLCSPCRAVHRWSAVFSCGLGRYSLADAWEAGYPSDPALHAQLLTVGDTEPTAVSFYDTHHVKLSHLTIDGQRPSKGWMEGGNALLVTGGRNAKDPVVQYCVLRHPRGWSCLHVRQTLFLMLAIAFHQGY